MTIRQFMDKLDEWTDNHPTLDTILSVIFGILSVLVWGLIAFAYACC